LMIHQNRSTISQLPPPLPFCISCAPPVHNPLPTPSRPLPRSDNVEAARNRVETAASAVPRSEASGLCNSGTVHDTASTGTNQPLPHWPLTPAFLHFLCTRCAQSAIHTFPAFTSIFSNPPTPALAAACRCSHDNILIHANRRKSVNTISSTAPKILN